MTVKPENSGFVPGDIIPFGAYPHTADGADKTPIQWRVLQNTGSELLILSEYILDCKRYDSEFADTTWRDCDLRKWLNGEFYTVAFSDSERHFIATGLSTDNGEGSPDTEDKVYLLGVGEMRQLAEQLGNDLFDKKRRAVGTEFAKAKKADGCHLYVYNGSMDAGYIVEDGARLGCSWWWMRSQPKSASRAAFVGVHGSLRGYGRVSLKYYGVRPALRLKLDFK